MESASSWAISSICPDENGDTTKRARRILGRNRLIGILFLLGLILLFSAPFFQLGFVGATFGVDRAQHGERPRVDIVDGDSESSRQCILHVVGVADQYALRAFHCLIELHRRALVAQLSLISPGTAIWAQRDPGFRRSIRNPLHLAVAAVQRPRCIAVASSTAEAVPAQKLSNEKSDARVLWPVTGR